MYSTIFNIYIVARKSKLIKKLGRVFERGSSGIENSCCSFRGHGLGFYHPYSGSEPCIFATLMCQCPPLIYMGSTGSQIGHIYTHR